MKYSKKKYNYYSDDERMSYIREYLSTSETKYQFAKRTGICRRLLAFVPSFLLIGLTSIK
jgi:transposase